MAAYVSSLLMSVCCTVQQWTVVTFDKAECCVHISSGKLFANVSRLNFSFFLCLRFLMPSSCHEVQFWTHKRPKGVSDTYILVLTFRCRNYVFKF